MRWLFPSPLDQIAISALQSALAIPAFAAAVLVRRGIIDQEKAQRFLQPRLKDLADPSQIPDLNVAVDRIAEALARHERIVLYGDYDVDGVTSLALLARVLRGVGGHVCVFLPHRIDEGYGLSCEGLDRCVQEHRPELLIAVDCGTTSIMEISDLRQRGVDVIVVDHHEPGPCLPLACAVVNPKRGSRSHYLCSVGLAFKVAHGLLKRCGRAAFDLREVLDLVALGTVADLVPLVEENRTFVRAGLTKLETTKWCGVRALIEVAGLKGPFNAADVAFALGPRLNAAGRLGTATAALNLLLSEDPAEAKKLAQSLDEQNSRRRATEDDVLKAAEAQIEASFLPERDAAIVVGSEAWHPGVVGIVASRVLKRFHRPTIVIGFDEAGTGKGSCRSIAGLCMVTALRDCSEHLVKFGGHEMAAGLTLSKDRFTAFREGFLAAAARKLTREQLTPLVRMDSELPFREIRPEILEYLTALEPFGIGNVRPIFFARRVSPADTPRVLKERHLQLWLEQDGVRRKAIWFGVGKNELPAAPWDIAFELSRNEYLGVVQVQIQVVSMRSSGSCSHGGL